jgi:hypothetical protein
MLLQTVIRDCRKIAMAFRENNFKAPVISAELTHFFKSPLPPFTKGGNKDMGNDKLLKRGKIRIFPLL